MPDVVLQVVLKSSRKDDANLAREIHHHRQFLHPHIARLYEVIVTENLVWLVLEYCPGMFCCIIMWRRGYWSFANLLGLFIHRRRVVQLSPQPWTHAD